MKTSTRKMLPSLLLATTLGIFAGCATTDYYRLSQTQNDIGFAMTRYQNQVTFGGVAPSFQSQVTFAYQAYKTAFDSALMQAHANSDAPTPDNVKQLADQLLSVLASIPAVP